MVGQPGKVLVQGDVRPLQHVQAQESTALLVVRDGLRLIVGPDEVIGGKHVFQGIGVPVRGLRRGRIPQAGVNGRPVGQIQRGKMIPHKDEHDRPVYLGEVLHQGRKAGVGMVQAQDQGV